MQILMIEDNENDFFLVHRLISKIDDVTIQRRDSLKAGLSYLRANVVDVLLLDMGLPDANGLEALDQLQTEFLALPIIILSANDADELALEAVRRGAQDYLVKGQTDDQMMGRALRYAIERKRLEERLRRSEALYRTFAHNFPNGSLALFDHDCRYTLVDGLGLAELGLSKEQMEGKTIWDVFPSEMAAAGECRMRAALAGETVTDEIMYAGQTVLMNYLPIRDRNGSIISGMIMSQNVSRRKQAETALAAERNLLRTLIDSIPDYVFVKDVQGRVVLTNAAGLKASGFASMDALAGKTDFDLFPRVLAQAFYDDEQQVLSSGQALINREEASIDLKSGEDLWYTTTKVPLKDEKGAIVGLVGISRDITERKRMEETLKSKMQEETTFQNYLKSLHEITIELTTIDEIDDFYKRSVELGIERLGFDRLGFLLYDTEAGAAQGTYGTDAQGRVVAEHHLRLDPSAFTSILMRALQKEERFAVDEEAPLFSNREPIGTGWKAAAVLWNGTDKLGWLSADNAVRHEPLTPNQLNMLALYAVTLGTLLAQKRSQIAVRESEKGLRLLAEISPDFIYILSLNEPGKFYVNRPEFLGYSKSDMQGSGSLLNAVYPGDKERVLGHWQTVTTQAESKRDAMIEYQMQDKSGQWHWIQSRETVFAADGDGKPIQILVTLTDISERKKAEESLRQERDLLRTLIENLPDYISIKDVHGRFILANSALARASNLPLDEMIGKTTFDILPKHLATLFHEDDLRIIKSGEPLVNVERNTGNKFFLTTKIPLWDKSREMTGIISISREITQHKQHEAQKLELESERRRIKVLQRFINDMSHDFRTPLTAINNALYLLKKSSDPQKQAVHINRAQQHIQRMDKLLEEILQMEHLDRGATTFQFSWTDMNAFIPPLIHEYEPISAAKQITVDFVSESDACAALIDKVEFTRVMTKLMENAITYTPDGGHISVGTRKEKDWVTISVQDTGIGILAEDLPHIFERFYRADRARSSETGGSGLGLSIVQKIVEAHNGRIDVESILGMGSTFSIRLPVASEVC